MKWKMKWKISTTNHHHFFYNRQYENNRREKKSYMIHVHIYMGDIHCGPLLLW